MRDRPTASPLAKHCEVRDTVALVHSSGVGKSKLVNTMAASPSAATQPVREIDGKGIHTTTVPRCLASDTARREAAGW
jgi:ribosome biogenesis GTPase